MLTKQVDPGQTRLVAGLSYVCVNGCARDCCGSGYGCGSGCARDHDRGRGRGMESAYAYAASLCQQQTDYSRMRERVGLVLYLARPVVCSHGSLPHE